MLSIYSSYADRDGVVDGLVELDFPITLLVGENWIINTPNHDDFAEALGGTVVSSD